MTATPTNLGQRRQCPVTALCLTGKPGAGCTTIGGFCSEIGIPELEPDAETVPEQALQCRPHCVWVDDVTAGTDVDGLVERVAGLDQALIIRVRVDDDLRFERLLDRELSRQGTDDRTNLTPDELERVRDDLRNSAHDPPHPRPHVSIHNGPGADPTGMIVRMDELSSIVCPDCDCPEHTEDPGSDEE